MEITGDISEVLAELDALRISRGMSYQDVADACGVSKSTIHRTLTGLTEPTVQLVKAIAAAVQYKPPKEKIFPAELTQDSYVSYLQELIQQSEKEHELHVQQLHSHYNMLRRQARREKIVWMILAIVFMATFVVLFLYDFTHLDRGWIQLHAAGLIQKWTGRLFLAARSWLGGILWSV